MHSDENIFEPWQLIYFFQNNDFYQTGKLVSAKFDVFRVRFPYVNSSEVIMQGWTLLNAHSQMREQIYFCEDKFCCTRRSCEYKFRKVSLLANVNFWTLEEIKKEWNKKSYLAVVHSPLKLRILMFYAARYGNQTVAYLKCYVIILYDSHTVYMLK